MTEASRHAMVEMVHLIFSQLDQLPDSLASTPLAGQQPALPRLLVRRAGGRAGGRAEWGVGRPRGGQPACLQLGMRDSGQRPRVSLEGNNSRS